MERKREYKFSYQTIVTYSSMVSSYHFLLRCTPSEESFQQIKEHQLQLLAPEKITLSRDAFGNVIHYGHLNDRHDLFVVASNGVVACDKYQIEESAPKIIYKTPTHLTLVDAEMLNFNRSVRCSGSTLETAMALSQALFNYMIYMPGKTSVGTTSIESFGMAAGVCQDFSHILIALCRERAIFARYVVGFVVGTGETHAWVEVWCDGVWYGVDPTHNRKVESGYIKLSHGRDADDCSVVRGTMRGSASHSTQIRVVVEEILK